MIEGLSASRQNAGQEVPEFRSTLPAPMRICLTVHGYPPFERTGVENYTRSLAKALVRAGHVVEVFAPCPAGDLPNLALRREVRDGVGINWLAAGRTARNPEEMLNPPGIASRFGAFLDRERPDVVHFQHVVKLGTGLIEEACRRKISTVYTAHDYYALCHRYTLLRPDLKRCETIGDPAACARCDQALAVLNRLETLGDYQMGVRPEQLPADERRQLAAALDGRPLDAGFTVGDQESALALRRQLDQRRLADFSKLDLVLAPTNFLRDSLIAGGLASERIQHLPYGIETADLERVARDFPVQLASGETAKPLRIGFFGGFSKHKGVHVLLEAFQKLRNPAELSLHGLGSDKPYVEALRKQADEVGARWCGAYESSVLPGLMAEVDVVVVPSLWVENYPIVIREAFAARRPVITSRLGALPESVRDGVDGLLFEPGDADALSTALDRLTSEAGLLAKLVQGIEPVHDIDQQVEELGGIYQRVMDSTRVESEQALPSSLVRHVERFRELNRLPTRELFREAMTGLHDLSAELLGKSGANAMELFAAAIGRGSNVQDLLRDRRRESDWVKQTLVAEEQELESLTEKLDWMNRVADAGNRTVDELREERRWLEESIEAKDVEIKALAAERDEVALARDNLDRQREWLQGALEAKNVEIGELEKKARWIEGVAAERDLAVEELNRKCAWLEDGWEQARGHVDQVASERDQVAADRDACLGRSAELQAELQVQKQQLDHQARDLNERDEAIARHEAIEFELRAWLESSREVLEAFEDEDGDPVNAADPELASSTKIVKANWESVLSDVERLLDSEDSRVAPAELGRRVEVFLDRLDTEERELHWRRGEMAWLSERVSRLAGRFALLTGRLRERLATWTKEVPKS